MEAIRSGRLGRIAICYIEWSGRGNQKVLIDWTVIQDTASAQRFAVQLAEAPRPFFGYTSVRSLSCGAPREETELQRPRPVDIRLPPRRSL